MLVGTALGQQLKFNRFCVVSHQPGVLLQLRVHPMPWSFACKTKAWPEPPYSQKASLWTSKFKKEYV